MAGITVYLIGLPGSGKTTLGRSAAEADGWAFHDMDAMIEAAAGMSIARIFDTEGEEGFRRRETAALTSLATSPTPITADPGAPQRSRIISTGGGIVEREFNRDLMAKSGTVIFIDRPVKHILHHLDASQRPLLSASPERIYELERRRRPLYESCCHHRIENLGYEDALEDLRSILRGLRQRG